MLAGIFAAEKTDTRSGIYEKNEKLGKKLIHYRKGHDATLTNAGEMETLFASVFEAILSFYTVDFTVLRMSRQSSFFENLGVRTKVERGNRVFPESDHSSDVISAMSRELKRLGAGIYLHTEVKQVLADEGHFTGIRLADGKTVSADACIIATGGISYPSTGSTGDGYRFAREAGHKVTALYPSLVPMEVKEAFIPALQGLSLRNVNAQRFMMGKRKLYEEFGEMLFTHFGVSGPVIISASSVIGKAAFWERGNSGLSIDLKPALSAEQLDAACASEILKRTGISSLRMQ